MTAVVTVLAVGAVTVLAGGAGGAAAPEDAPARCQGQRATIVADRGTVRGTPGDDVIVMHGRARGVHSGAGDDIICVRRRDGRVFVDAGPGEDRVEVESRTEVTGFLHEGADEYLGGPGRDRVYSGEDGVPNRDRVDLRGGDDTIRLTSRSRHSAATIIGGGGRDLFGLDALARRVLKVDATVGTARLRGRHFASWAAFEDYDLRSFGGIRFLGSDASESVELLAFGSAAASLGGGDDVVTVDWGHGDRSSPPVVDGGPGTDLLALGVGERSVVASVASHRIDSTVGAPVGLDIPGFEGLAIATGRSPASRSFMGGRTRVELVGDDGDNVLMASACDVIIRGGAGDDHLTVGDRPDDDEAVETTGARECAQTSTVFGEAGDDVMVSHGTTYTRRAAEETPIADLLDGGDGTDTARAGAGIDTCIAEVRVDCEA